jgi:hypothetical protein
MIEPPAQDTALYAQVLRVLDEVDPERQHHDATGGTYLDLAATLTAVLETDTELSPELLSTLWLIWAGSDARLLQPAYRILLNQLARRLEDLRPGAHKETLMLETASTGRWLVFSRGTVHVLDLDAGTYERRPGPTSQTFAYDNQPLPLTRIEVWPEVGGRMIVWFDDPVHPPALEHYRVCSRIRSITSALAPPTQ